MARIRKSDHTQDRSANRWNVALYIRLSREDGNDESLSVVNQKKILKEHVDTFLEPLDIVDYYIDDGMTGTDYDRPDFQRMMKDIESHRVNCVIVKDLARAFRNYSDQGYFLETFFPKNNVRFITIGTPKIDSYLMPESVSGFDVPITGVMNDRYCKKTSDDVRRTFDMKRRRGEFIGAFAPYGYVKSPDNKNQFIVDEEAADVVRKIFTQYVNEGYSINGIARRLNDTGIPNPAEYKRLKGMKFQNPNTANNDGLWSRSTVHGILKNQMYVGSMVQGKYRIKSYKVHTQISVPEDEWYVVPNTHEAIVDPELFEKAQTLLSRDTRTAPGNGQVYLFSGLVRCADCNKAMTRRKSGKNVYYACRTYTEKSRTKCSRHSINLTVLENSVLAAIRKQIELIGSMSEIIKEINSAPILKTQSNRLGYLLKTREDELEKLRNMNDSLYVDWKAGTISRDEYLRMKAKFGGQIGQIEQALSKIKKEISVLSDGISQDDPYLTNFLKYRNINSLDRGLLVELINTIYVHEGGELTIEFNFEDQYLRVVEFIENSKNDLTLVQTP